MGLRNVSGQVPVAPMSCAFDPMRTYADRNAVACRGFCLKWSSVTILPDGGLEVHVLRGCQETLIDSSINPPPQEPKCYQTPHDMNHEVGQEYITSCYCNHFMCNSTQDSLGLISITLVLCIYKLFS
ncbi:unnamed protein product [Caenorhabditis auriculariae]|uniref:Uncharacterized protein n=1 Tax=Caenorhabditis auriculariae TaxID=2777116 RepID=A0A8S1HS90_9PELO|nr:unnamed protein product [Caenorhabditis auriculariae]